MDYCLTDDSDEQRYCGRFPDSGEDAMLSPSELQTLHSIRGKWGPKHSKGLSPMQGNNAIKEKCCI